MIEGSCIICLIVGNNQKEVKIGKSVRQGCNLSPILFNLYIEKTLEELR